MKRTEKSTSRIVLAFLAGCLALTLAAAPASAEETDTPSASVELGVFSKYVWRGYELSDDGIVIQPSLTVGYKGVSVNLWGNLDTNASGDDGDDETQFNETDLTLSYEKSFGMVTTDVGYCYYALDGMKDSQELFASIGLDVFLAPTLTVYREISYLPGWYFSFGLSHSFELREGITLDLSGSIGYMISDDDEVAEVDDALNPTSEKYSGFHDGNLSVGLTVPLGEYWTVSPMIAYSFPLTDEADNLIEATSISGESDFLYGGVTVSFAF